MSNHWPFPRNLSQAIDAVYEYYFREMQADVSPWTFVLSLLRSLAVNLDKPLRQSFRGPNCVRDT